MSFDEEIDSVRTQCLSLFGPTVLGVSGGVIESLAQHRLLDSGIYIGIVDIKATEDAMQLFDSIARSCGFPGYFGRNWDALKDCLLDFSWVSPKPHGIVLLFRHPEMMNWTDIAKFIIVCESVRMVYAKSKKPFKVLMATRTQR